MCPPLRSAPRTALTRPRACPLAHHHPFRSPRPRRGALSDEAARAIESGRAAASRAATRQGAAMRHPTSTRGIWSNLSICLSIFQYPNLPEAHIASLALEHRRTCTSDVSAGVLTPTPKDGARALHRRHTRGRHRAHRRPPMAGRPARPAEKRNRPRGDRGDARDDLLDPGAHRRTAVGIVPWHLMVRLDSATEQRWVDNDWALYPRQRHYASPYRTPSAMSPPRGVNPCRFPTRSGSTHLLPAPFRKCAAMAGVKMSSSSMASSSNLH